MRCKFSGKPIKPFMSFGKMPLANSPITKNQFKKETRFLFHSHENDEK